MQQQSEIIEARIRLRIDPIASPQLYELFSSVDNSRFSTLVSIMLERCIAYEKTFLAHGGLMLASPPIRVSHAPEETNLGGDSLQGMQPHKATVSVASRGQGAVVRNPAVPAEKAPPINQPVENQSNEGNENPATIHDPAEMAMALGGLGL